MMLVLDTNVLIELEARNPKTIDALKKLAKKHGGDACITAPTFSEFYYGFMKKTSGKKTKALEHLSEYCLLNTNTKSSRILAELKHELNQKGKAIPLMDLLIASIVLAHDGTLVTQDKDFKRVQGLKAELI